jgi:hypothetical protein
MKNLHIIPTDKPSRLVLETINNNLFLTTTTEFPSKIMVFKNIYITNDEKIKEGDYVIWNGKVYKDSKRSFTGVDYSQCKKIILTTDQSLEGVQAISDEFLEWFVKNPNCEEVKVNELRFFNPDTNESAHCKWEYDLPQEEPKEEKWDKLNKELDDALEEAFGTSPSNILDFENAKLVLREHLIANKEEVVKDLEQMREWSNTNKQETLEEAAEKRIPTSTKVWDLTETRRNDFIAGANYQAERMYSEEDVIQLLIKFNQEVREIEDVREWFKQFKKK